MDSTFTQEENDFYWEVYDYWDYEPAFKKMVQENDWFNLKMEEDEEKVFN